MGNMCQRTLPTTEIDYKETQGHESNQTPKKSKIDFTYYTLQKKLWSIQWVAWKFRPTLVAKTIASEMMGLNTLKTIGLQQTRIQTANLL